MCKHENFQVGDYEREHQTMIKLPFGTSATICGFVPKSMKRCILFPLQSATGGMRRFELINNIISNIPPEE